MPDIRTIHYHTIIPTSLVKKPNKDALADLVRRAKGEERSLTSFAFDCGVSPSTLSRIINRKGNKANSDDLIAAIAENADPQSGVHRVFGHQVSKIRAFARIADY